eukprot:COSAG02_NODE_5046_length_4699_cov_2.745652_5_plen_468_part_00
MSQGASFSTVGKFGSVGADGRAAARVAADAQAQRRMKLEPGRDDDDAVGEDQMLQQLLQHFDSDGSGALDYEEFVNFFKALDPSASLSRSEFVELCESLDMPPATGVCSLKMFFDDDLAAIRALHAKVVVAAAKASGPCPVCGCLPNSMAGGERMQVALGGCLCHELRAEFCGTAPAKLKFGKHKDRTLLDVYFEEPDYMRWLVENSAPPKSVGGTVLSETDRFIARVAGCEHYLKHYFVEREPEPESLPAGDPMDRLTRQRHGTQGMDRMTEYDEFVGTGLISDDRGKGSRASKMSVGQQRTSELQRKQQQEPSYYEMLFSKVARPGGGGTGGPITSVSARDFKQSGAQLGLSDDAATALFEGMDTNNDGEISFDEFVAGYTVFAAAASGTQAEQEARVAKQIDLCALDLAIAAGFAQGSAVLICDPTVRYSCALSIIICTFLIVCCATGAGFPIPCVSERRHSGL